MTGLTRRELVAGAALSGAALTLGSCADEDTSPGRRDRVIVVGAGMAGIGAARALRAEGITPIILEARSRIGGRVHTANDLGVPLDRGGAWIHDPRGNPLASVARKARLTQMPTPYDRVDLRRTDGQSPSDAAWSSAEDALSEIESGLETRAAEAERGDRFLPALQKLQAGQQLSGDVKAIVDWFLGVGLPLDLAAGLGELGLEALDEGEEYDGGTDVLLREGAGALVRSLGGRLRVRTGAAVRSIAHRGDGVTVTLRSGVEVEADGCIVTVPLALLKRGTIDFAPALPAEYREAIDRLGVGLLNKVMLRYDKVWWPDVTQLGVIGARIDDTVTAINAGPLTGKPILVAFVGGDYARTLESRGVQETVSIITDRLAAGFGARVRSPTAAAVTRWGQDRWAMGSYSFLAPEATGADRGRLGQRMGRLMLAGEHTSVRRPSTMDGALLEGQRAGRELARALS